MALHHAYGAIENAMARTRRAMEGDALSGARWHEELLSAMALDLAPVRPAILSKDSLTALRTLLGFRHFFRHAYAVALDPARLGELRRVALAALPYLESDFQRLDALLAGLAAT